MRLFIGILVVVGITMSSIWLFSSTVDHSFKTCIVGLVQLDPTLTLATAVPRCGVALRRDLPVPQMSLGGKVPFLEPMDDIAIPE